MAQPPRAAANGDNFVRHIVADPKNVPDVMLLYGYPGASSEEGHERLYLSPDLSAYVEVPNAAILHRAESAKEQDPHGGVTLWVKKDAALIHKMAPAQQAAQQALAYYFAGALQGGGGAQPGAQAGMAALPQTLPNAACPITLPNAACPVSVANPPCLTHNVTCVATCHATCAATCVGTCAQHATCGVTCIATCQATCFATCQATCPPHATCGATCVATCHATCAATCVATCHVTCAPVCTHITPCRPTLNQPECPFPTEICTHVAAQCTQLPNCRIPQAAQAGMGAQCAGGTILASVQVACGVTRLPIECSEVCPTRVPECWVTRLPIECSVVCPTRFVTCNPECNLTRNPAVCPVASGAVCPPQSLGCPQQSLGCGGVGPVEQAQICAVGSVVRPPQVTLVCTIEGCATWHASCWWGCPPRTPQCPW